MQNTLLLADDDIELSGLLKEYFGSEGFEVRLAHDGVEALEELRKPGLDLVVLDVMMPRMNGMDVLRELRKESRLPVIMLTARGDDMDRILGLELGADDYVPKPCNPRELLARIRAVMRRAQGSVDHGLIHVARPVRIEGGFTRISNLDYTFEIINQEQYSRITNKTLTSSYPKYIYYEPEYPLGKLWAHPVPNTSVSIYFNSWKQLQQFSS